MKDIAIFGEGGYGREVSCLIRKINERTKEWNFIGFYDDDETKWGTSNDYGKVLGGMETLNKREEPLSIVIAIANPKVIPLIVSRITNRRIDFPNIADPDISYLDKQSFKIGQGNILGYGCRFSINVGIGDFNIIINATTFGHDARIGNYNVLFPETRLSGMVEVGDRNFFGMRTAVIQGIKVGSDTRIWAGSFVMRNTKDGLSYSGNPAKKIAL